MNSKTISYKIAAIAIITLLSFPTITSVFSFGLPAGADAASWYKTVPGVLATDKYSLYPYQKKSLTIGFSKFGEMINALPTQRVGLQYGDRDPFAPPAGSSEPAGIPQRKWFQGWFINITYIHAVATPNSRNVWAIAMAGATDTSTFGNQWVRVDHTQVNVAGGKKAGGNDDTWEDPLDKGKFINDAGDDYVGTTQADGGRKTNGSATTMPIKVLYDGPRRYVAQVETIVSDVLDEEARPFPLEPLVKIVFTIDFNKVKKEVNVLKDIKLLFVKFQYGVMDVTTNNKTTHNGEWTDCHNYNYTGGVIDSYQGMYIQFSNRGEWDLGPAPVFDSYGHFFTDGPGENKSALKGGYGKGWKGWQLHSWEGMTTVYDREYALIRTAPPNALARWGIEPDKSGLDTYDLAQIVSSDLKYVGFAGFWPSLSDWSIDGVTDDLWWRSIAAEDIHREDLKVEPFTSPFVIGEWDFILTPNPKYDPVSKIEGDIQFRGVTVYGVTDLNKGLDSIVGNEIDSFDYADGVPVGDGDDANRLVGAMNIVDREVYYQLSEVYRPWDLKKATSGYYYDGIVDGREECECEEEPKSERHVIIIPDAAVISVPLDATWPETLWDSWGVPFYSRTYRDVSAPDGVIGDEQNEVGEWFAYSTFPERVLLDGQLLVRGKDYWIVGEDLSQIASALDGPMKPGNYLVNASILFPSYVYGDLKILYSVFDPAYEWIAVGAKAASVDSAGAAMVAEAFAWNEDIPVQWGSLDRSDVDNGPTVPYLMSKVGEGWLWSDYYYDDGVDYRTALQDDWSTTVPIASSNIINVGGPAVSLVAQYFNEFTPVIYRGQFMWPLEDLLPVSDWGGNKGTDVAEGPYAGPGYAVITTYKDINGTVGFNVWGMTGDDSFWASAALWNTGWMENKPGLDIYKILRVDDPSLGEGEVFGNGNGDLDSKDPLVPVHLSVIKFWMMETGMSMEELSLTLNADMIAIAEAFLDNKPIPLSTFFADFENCGITAVILSIDYTNMSYYGDIHPIITIVEELAPKSEKPQHPDP